MGDAVTSPWLDARGLHGQLLHLPLPRPLSTAPYAPHLAGQSQPYVAAQLRAFRSGARPHEVMAVMARMLSDTDIDNLPAWFASLRVQVKEPR